jgi:RimJ/RimL family protein N-acetyltransferase
MFARTERLLLRPGFVEDAPALAQAIGHEAVVRNLATAPWPYSEQDAHSFLSMERDPTLPSFIIMQRTGGAPRIVGGIGIGPSPEDGLELGYWIAPRYWGLGFATEAGRAVLSIARAMKLPRLNAGHFIDNPASGSVLRKLGFRPTGRTAPRRSMGRGGTVEVTLYEEGDAVGGRPKSGMRSRITPDADFRQDIRLMAA